MGKGNRVVANANLRAGVAAGLVQVRDAVVLRPGHLAEVLLRQLDQLIVVDAAGSGQNESVRIRYCRVTNLYTPLSAAKLGRLIYFFFFFRILNREFESRLRVPIYTSRNN